MPSKNAVTMPFGTGAFLIYTQRNNLINLIINQFKFIMKKKVFSLMMTLLLAFIGVARADVVTIGDPTSTTTNSYLPGYTLYDYAISQQIYTADEIGVGGTINTLTMWLKNSSSYARNINVYMKEVSESTFASNTSWVSMTASDMVGSFTMPNNVSTPVETPITLSTPFAYSGNGNLVICFQDVTGQWSSGLGGVEMAANGNQALYAYRDGTEFNVSNPGVTGTLLAKKNVVRLNITTGGGGGGGGAGAGEQIFAMQDEQIVDTVYVGARPNGCWMEPFTFQLINTGAATTITNIDWTPLDYFTLVAPELPVAFDSNDTIDVQLTTGESDNTDWQMVALYGNTRLAAIWNVKVEPYDPICPDVVEEAYDIDEEENNNNPLQPGFTTALNAHQIHLDKGGDGELHNDYTLPFPEIEDGYDAVYKFSVENDAMLTAIMDSTAYQGKVALYRQEGEEFPHPMADNNYTGISLGMNTAGSTGSGSGYVAMIGDEASTSTTGYVPMYYLYNNSLSTQLFLGTELVASGANTNPMASISWYSESTYGYNIQNISIWMANVSDTQVSATSPLGSGMTLVYNGNFQEVVGWNEFVFNSGSFAWDGHSNVLVMVQMNNGNWDSSISWKCHNPGFTASSYVYQDNTAYNAGSSTYGMSTSSSIRANTRFKSNGSRAEISRDVVTIGEGTGTTYYFPIDNYFNYSCTEQIYTADEIGTAGTINSISFYYNYGTAYTANNVTMYMKNVTRDSFASQTDCEPLAASDVVWTGSIAPTAAGWYTFNLDTPFYYDGTSNLLVAFFDGTSGYPGTSYTWRQTTSPGSANMALRYYSDSSCPDPYNLATYGGSKATYTYRSNIQLDITPGSGGNQGSGNEALNISAGPEITNLPLIPGTYYLVSSALTSDDDHLVNFAIDAMPCPAIDAEGFALNPSPADDDTVGVQPSNVTLRWMVPEYTTRWRIIIGSTYWPELNHPYTQYYPQDEDGNWTWSTTIANSWNVPEDLFNNTNYFWRVEFANDGCVDGVSSPVFGFTTHLNVPQDLVVEDETVFEEDTIRLSWRAVVDRTYRRYFIYRNYGPVSNSADVFEKIGETTEHDINATSFEDGPLSYNMNGYTYYVTAVYDEGESHPSNTVNVKVSGKGFVNGHVFEQDGVVGIAGATVHMVGNDEFGGSHTYDFITDENGYYEGTVYATTPNDGDNSNGYNGSASCPGYQPIDHPVQGNPIEIVYNQTTTPIDYMLDENFYGPCGVVAQYYPDSTDVNAEYVKVYWGCGLPTGAIIEDFEDFENSNFEWQNDPTYPWTIVATNPYEGESCLKSGGAGVANVNSNMSVTVNVPRDGVMAFYGKISCESNWDYGYFYIDGVEKGSYTGAGSWVERTFPITAGEHTFKWSYQKDSSVNNNDDCFYVDYITFWRPEESQSRNDNNRAFSHYRVYRTNCYNPGPYDSIPNDVEPFYPNPMSTSVLSCEVTDTVYIDTYWADPEITPPGVYKWGVGCVYVGNRGEEIESPITWSEPVHVVPAAAATETRDVVTIGDGTGTTYYGPYNSLWGYSFVEQVYTAAEIGTAGTINSISFNMSESEADQTNQIDVFMKNVSRTSFADNADWEPVTNSDKVFSGTVTFQGGWTTITLDNPFYYNGTDNLMIGMHEYTSGYSTRYFYYTTVSNALISGHSDTSDPDPTNMAAFTGTKYVQNYRNNIQIDITPGGGGGSGTLENLYPAGNEPIQEERESVIVWSNCLDKDMYINPVDVTVLLNSADSPEGAVVTLTNLNEVEEDAYGVDPVTLDESGFYAWETFRRGYYAVKVELEGYYTIYDTADIWNAPTHLRYVMIEQLSGVSNVYVSRTGWAMWDEPTYDGGEAGGPRVIDFEGQAIPEDFTNSAQYPWTVVNNAPSHDSYCMKSGNGGVASSTSAISVTVDYAADGTVSFDGGCWGEGTSTAWDQCVFSIDGAQQFANGALQTWNNYSYNVAAGSHTFEWKYTKDSSVNPDTDAFFVDNITFAGGRVREDNRHFEYYKVLCTSIDGVPIFNHNVVVPMCQLSTNEPYNAPLVEGEHYLCKVAVMYSTGMSEWSEPVEWEYEPCDHWGPVDDVAVTTLNQGNHIEWVFEHGFNPYANDSLNPDDPQGGDNVTVILRTDDVWGDGSGYQMLLDADATACGIDFQATGGYAPTSYANFEYMIPEDADPNLNTTHMICNSSGSVVIPAGVYDWVICNPTPGDANYIASSNGNIGGRYDDFTFEAGHTYEFYVYFGGYNDATDLTVTGGAKSFRSMGQPNIDCKDITKVKPIAGGKGGGLNLTIGGEFYTQYAEDGVMLNFFAEDNVYFRAYFLYTLSKDNRFKVMAGEKYGMFIVNPTDEMYDFMDAFEDFYSNAVADFAVMSKPEVTEATSIWKSGIAPTDYLWIMMDVYSITSRSENDNCLNSLPFCTSEVIEFPAAHDGGATAEENAEFGCVSSQPYPSWYHMRIASAGQFVIHMEAHDPDNPSANRDIDYCLWGPFDDPYEPCANDLTCDKIIDCSYSAASVEDAYVGYPLSQHDHDGSSLADGSCINYHVPEVGEYYILMITNYSQQQCNISFTKTEGEGETDCNIVNPTVDIIGFLITMDGEYLDIVGPDVRDYLHEGEYGEHTYCVRPIYPGEMVLPDHNYGWSMGCPVCQETGGGFTCLPGDPIHAEVLNATDQVKIWWGEQEPEPEPFFEDFEGGDIPEGWLVVRNGGGTEATDWHVINGETAFSSGPMPAHSGTYMVMGRSWSGSAYNVDNWLITPQVNLGGMLSYWVQDDGQYHENVDVYVSTTTTDINAFTLLADPASATADWSERTVDLTSYNGQMGYIAFRLVDNDQDYIFIDDVTIGAGRSNRVEIDHYNVYRSEDNVEYAVVGTVNYVEGQTYYEYIDTPDAAGTYFYKVTAVYDDGCESDGAPAFDNPDNNYVEVTVTGLDENNDKVALYPNPTNGNVTIEANGMNRIIVVSVLGQVVFDTELDADSYTLNMGQFNAGMYMVRVYTEDGMTVKRVTVMK